MSVTTKIIIVVLVTQFFLFLLRLFLLPFFFLFLLLAFIKNSIPKIEKKKRKKKRIQIHIIISICFFSFVWLPIDGCAFMSAQDTLDIYSCMLSCTFPIGKLCLRV